MKHCAVAGACVFKSNPRKDNQSEVTILIVRDKWGNWNFPKEYFETSDKSSLDCAQREVKEESNIEFAELTKFTTHYEELRTKVRIPNSTINKHVIIHIGYALYYTELKHDGIEIVETMNATKAKFYELVSNVSEHLALEAVYQLINYNNKTL